MNCDVIRDLLPLYIEKLCSAKSNEEVEAHLATCEDCQKEYLQLRQDYTAHTDCQGMEDYLGGKDLLEKSKHELKQSFADNIINKIFTVLLVLGILINIAMVGITCISYGYQYPRLYFRELGFTQVCILVLPFVPTLIAFVGKIAVVKLKKYRFVSRLLLVGMVPAVLFGGFCTLIFWVIPPVASATYNSAHYMETDGDTELFADAINDFYPGQIPGDAKQIDYHYERYSSLFSERVSMEAAWILPSDAYEAAKQHALGLSPFQSSAVSESGGSGSVLSTVYPGNVTMVFEYNDEIMKVTYRAYASKRY